MGWSDRLAQVWKEKGRRVAYRVDKAYIRQTRERLFQPLIKCLPRLQSALSPDLVEQAEGREANSKIPIALLNSLMSSKTKLHRFSGEPP